VGLHLRLSERNFVQAVPWLCYSPCKVNILLHTRSFVPTSEQNNLSPTKACQRALNRLFEISFRSGYLFQKNDTSVTNDLTFPPRFFSTSIEPNITLSSAPSYGLLVKYIAAILDCSNDRRPKPAASATFQCPISTLSRLTNPSIDRFTSYSFFQCSPTPNRRLRGFLQISMVMDSLH
jgi:hypothetical protein